MTNNTTNTTDITQRLDRMERQNRRLKLGLFAMALGSGALFGALFLIAALPPSSQTVMARKVLLVDHNGKTRASLAMNDSGQPELTLFSRHGKPRADLTLSRFTLYGKAGKPEIYIGNSYDLPDAPLPLVSLTASSYGSALALDAHPFKSNGSIFLSAFDGEEPDINVGEIADFGKSAIDLTLASDGKPTIRLTDTTGVPRLVLGETQLTSKTQGGSTTTPLSAITAFDKKGTVIGQWP